MLGIHYRWIVVTSAIVCLGLAACGGEPASTPESDATQELSPAAAEQEDVPSEAASATPESTATRELDPYRAELLELALHPCELTPLDDLASTIEPSPDAPGIEAVETDPQTGSITSTCTFEGFFVVTMFFPGEGVDLRESYDRVVPDDLVTANTTDYLDEWSPGTTTLYVLENAVWYSVTLQDGLSSRNSTPAYAIYHLLAAITPEDTFIPTETPEATIGPAEVADACLLLSEQDVRPLGEPVGTPTREGDLSPEWVGSQSCSHLSADGELIVTVTGYESDEQAQADFAQRTAGAPEDDREFIGDAAFSVAPEKPGAQVVVLHGRLVLDVFWYKPGSDMRGNAAFLATRAMQRLPQVWQQ